MIPFAPDLTFLAPERFALLMVPMLFAALYLVRQRRRRAYVVRYTDLDMIDAVASERRSSITNNSPIALALDFVRLPMPG